MNSKSHEVEMSIQDCLSACGIRSRDYADLIQALSLATSKDPIKHSKTKFDRAGYPLAIASVTRVFDGFTVVAEDRGTEYAVWVTKTGKNGTTEEVIGFAEFSWGRKSGRDRQ